MEIRLATPNDTIHIIRAIQNKKLDFLTCADVKNDIAHHYMYVAVENDKILGSMIVKYKPHRGYYAIMRGCVYSKRNQGKGIAQALLDYILALNLSPYGATPWDDNPAVCHIFEKRGFVYQYTFNEHYKFYLKNA